MNNTPKNQNEQLDLAGRQYEVEDYNRNDQLSSGLATTHEQVSDSYMEGEIAPVVEDADGKDIPLKSDSINKQP
jgi:hypothetical protein